MKVVFDLDEWNKVDLDVFLESEVSIHAVAGSSQLLITSEKHTVILNEFAKSLLELIEEGGVKEVFGIDNNAHLKLERDGAHLIIIIYNDFLDQADQTLIYDLFEFSEAYFKALKVYLDEFKLFKDERATLVRLDQQLKAYKNLA